MTRKIKYREAFWGLEFCSTAGFDRLISKFKEGCKSCHGIEEIIRNRAKAEEEYAKQLLKLTKNVTIQDMGSILGAFDVLVLETERSANEHFEASQKMYKAADRLTAFNEYQKLAKKSDEEQVKKSSKKKTDVYKKTIELKKTYEKACQENESATEQWKEINANMSGVTTKEHDKVKSRHQKAVSAEQATEHTYRQNVDLLNELRVQWEQDMGRFCDQIEDLEEKRLKNLRNEMWVYSNIISQTCVVDDDKADSLRKALEKCDFDRDIEYFINNEQTGRDKPDAIAFEDFRKRGGSSNPRVQISGPFHRERPSPSPRGPAAGNVRFNRR